MTTTTHRRTEPACRLCGGDLVMHCRVLSSGEPVPAHPGPDAIAVPCPCVRADARQAMAAALHTVATLPVEERVDSLGDINTLRNAYAAADGETDGEIAATLYRQVADQARALVRRVGGGQ